MLRTKDSYQYKVRRPLSGFIGQSLASRFHGQQELDKKHLLPVQRCATEDCILVGRQIQAQHSA
jgi:hypothetical protein